MPQADDPSPDSDQPSGQQRGPAERLLAIGGRVLAAITAALQTRVELLATEMAAERARFGWLLLSALAIAVAALLGLAFTSFLVIAYFWDDHRLAAIAAVAGFYWLIALILALTLRRWFDRRQRPFKATVETLRRDYAAILGSIGVTPMKHDAPHDRPDLPDRDNR